MITPIRRLAHLGLALPFLAGCGAGTAAILSNSGSDSGGTAPALTAFQVANPKVSPADLHLEASEAVVAELFYAVAGGSEARMTMLTGPGVSGNQVQLPAGTSDITWDFATELQATAFVPEVDLIVRHPNGAPISGGSLHLGLGNDPPVVLSVEPMPTDPADPSESSGNVEVRLEAGDSSSDVVAIQVEWRRTSDAPDAWQPATAAGVFPDGIETDTDGVELSFFWNTNVDLADGDDDVLLRVTADDGTLASNGDPIGVSVPVVSPPLHVDNNDEPIVQLLNDAVIANPDELRGISVPCRVFDEEGDPVELILQWRREGEEFPVLPEDDAALDALLADPTQRLESHVCTPYPRFAQGRVLPVDASSVRLPELASGEAWLLAFGLEGQTLELLRPSSIPTPITPTWSSNPLLGPVAALPLVDGLKALVLDAPGGSWRLRQIELATGKVLPEANAVLASGLGAPSAMSLEWDEQGVLVASDVAGTWRIERVELATGATTELIVSDGSQPGPVRGIANLGTRSAAFTAGTALLHLDYRDPQPVRLASLLTDLASPWGVVVDRQAPDRLYVSERDANRVLVVDLGSHGSLPLVAETGGLSPDALERPEALALERGGSRLLVVTNTAAGASRLVGLDLGAPGGNVAFPIGEPRTTPSAGLATGGDGLRVVALPDLGELLVAGGVEQRRTIQSYEPELPVSLRTQRAVVHPPFAPSPAPGQPWRIPFGAFLHARPDGVEVRFAWDSREARSGQVFLRARARDGELGAPAAAAATKTVRSPLDVEPFLLDPTFFSGSCSAALGDLDEDGDTDIVCADRTTTQNLLVYLQDSPGVYQTPRVLGGPDVTGDPVSVAIGDLDEDGDPDIVSSNAGTHTVTVFFQQSPGVFGTALVLGGPGVTDNPFAVALGDLDDDGDQDIAVSLFPGGVALFFQGPAGSFGPPQRMSALLGGIAIADLDGDGDADIVGGSGTLGLAFLFQGPPGSFTMQEQPGPPVFCVAVGDLDGDGDQDIAGTTGGDVEVYFQTSPGSYSGSVTLSSPVVMGGDRPLAIGDFDGDADQDVLLAGATGGVLSVFFQEAPGVFGTHPLVLAGVDNSASVVVGDLDGDGDQDIVGSGFFAQVFRQESPGRFGVPDLLSPASAAFTSHFDIAMGDLDGDGDQDLVGVGRTDNVSIYWQGSPRSFDAPTTELGGPLVVQPHFVETGDFDGDGDLDIVSSNFETLIIFFQLSRGSFGPAQLLYEAPIQNPFTVATGDLDGDGDLDIVAGAPPGTLVFTQDSPGSFGAPQFLTGAAGGLIRIADIDGDGLVDILSGNSVFFRDASGFGSDPVDVPTGPRFDDIRMGDLDGDGDLDFVTANADANDLSVYLQGPARTFATPTLFLGGPDVTPFPTQVAIGDLDGDGQQDLVVASRGSPGPDRLTAFFQRSPGRFAPGRELASSGNVGNIRHVDIYDLDGDGEQDIVTTLFTTAVLWGGR